MKVTLTGIDDVNDLLTKVGPRTGYNLMRSTVHGVAGEIRDNSKEFAPADRGVLKKATKTKRARGRPGWVQSNVMVTLAAYYWRFLEYGQGPDGVEHAMFMRAIEKIRPKMNKIFVEQFGKKWEAALARASKR